MYCKHCGSEMDEQTKICTNCNRVDDVVIYEKEHKKEVKDSGNFGYSVLGFFVPIAGLILYLVWKEEQPKNAKKSLNGAITYLIVNVAMTIIGLIIYFLFIVLISGTAFIFMQ